MLTVALRQYVLTKYAGADDDTDFSVLAINSPLQHKSSAGHPMITNHHLENRFYWILM